MAKILADGTIQVTKGDTLSGIYGSDWAKLSGYKGDPTKLQIGTILPAKPTVAPTTPPATTPPATTIGGAYAGLIEPATALEKEARLAREAQISAGQQEAPDMAKIREAQMQQMQAEIDSLNTIYAQKKAQVTSQYQKIGTGRVGQLGAIQARRGLLGSSFGEQANQELDTANTEELNAAVNVVDTERQDRVSALMGIVRDNTQKEFAAKQLAYQGTLADKLAYINEKTTRQKDSVSKAVKAAILSKVELKDVADKDLVAIAGQLGISPEALVNAYTTEKTAYDKAQAEATAKANKEALELEKTTAEITKIKADTNKLYQDSTNKEEKDFYADVMKYQEYLSTGKADWGQAFSYLKSQYGTPDAVIDKLLNKDIWSKAGAYQEKVKGAKSDTGNTFIIQPTPPG